MQLNLMPFIVEAFGYNKTIYADIDKLYQLRKNEYYNVARQHELYNHQIITEGGLLQEEYCKKALGILLCAESDENVRKEITDIIRKGWTYAFLYVQNHEQIDLRDFLKRLINKHGGIDKVSDDFINTYLFMCFYLAVNSGKEVKENTLYAELLDVLKLRYEHYEANHPQRISLNKAGEEEIKKLKEIKKLIYSRYGVIKDMNSLLKALEVETNQIAFLFDFERLSIMSIIENVQFDENDIDEILLVYIVTHDISSTQDIVEDCVKYLMFAMYIKYLAKAYKEVKKRYFENNKETIYIELDLLERELDESKKEISRYVNRISELEKAIMALEKENKRLAIELERACYSKKELHGLREFLFSMDNKEDYEYDEKEIDYEILKNAKGVVVGGHERWQAKMKEYLPNFTFIHPDNKAFDVRIFKGADIVFVFANYLNHNIYEKAMDVAKESGIDVVYLNQRNEILVLKEIEKSLVNRQS